MTKLVQPNVLRTYQSGEQYAANEICLYNGAPAYTNTALAQGVAGTAGNFTNIGGNTFSDSLFRIQDDGDATKQIAFQASGIATGEERTITMPDADVNLGKIPSSMSYSAGSISLTTADQASLVVAIGDLPAYATTNSNSITGSLSQILGGTGNTANGANTIMIGGKYNSNEAGANFQTYINAQNLGTHVVKTINARISSSATLSGSGTGDVKTVSAEYNLINNHVYNTYATADGVQTLDAFHLPPGVIGEKGHGIHELTFMAIANNNGSASATFYDRRMSGKRLFHVNKDNGGTYSISSIQTIGTDISTDTATLSITIDATGLILIAITSVFVGSTEARISLMCNLKSTYAYTGWF